MIRGIIVIWKMEKNISGDNMDFIREEERRIGVGNLTCLPVSTYTLSGIAINTIRAEKLVDKIKFNIIRKAWKYRTMFSKSVVYTLIDLEEREKKIDE